MTSPQGPQRWTAERIARLGYLIGLGRDAKAVAADPIVATRVNNVYRQAGRFGLAFRSADTEGVYLPDALACRFDAAAAARGFTRDRMIRLLLTTIAEDVALIDAILDDNGGRDEKRV